MYNSTFKMTVSSTTPKSREFDGGTVTDIIISGVINGAKNEFLDDVDFGINAKGLKTLLESDLPIKYPVRLNYVKKVDTTLAFKEFKTEPECELQEIFATKPDSEGLMQLVLKIRLIDIDAKNAGVIVSCLKKTVDMRIVSKQLGLFKEKH